ncbi:MAG: hypothetical protein WCN98_10630, partial [Verrucomicrobiaceae bacterium]
MQRVHCTLSEPLRNAFSKLRPNVPAGPLSDRGPLFLLDRGLISLALCFSLALPPILAVAFLSIDVV